MYYEYIRTRATPSGWIRNAVYNFLRICNCLQLVSYKAVIIASARQSKK